MAPHIKWPENDSDGDDDYMPEGTKVKLKPKGVTLIPLIFLIYFEVAGGPFGEEPAVQAAGPLIALLGFLAFPFIWSAPEALITAELSTTFPGNGGYVIWAEQALGPFAGSLMGTWKLLSGIINLASFPLLFIQYLEKLFPVFSSGLPWNLGIFSFTMFLSFLNYIGLSVVGYATVVLGVVSLMPFIIMSGIAIPKIKPHRWLSLGDKGVEKDWNLYLNTLFWNLNFWDSVSTLAGEVHNPKKTFPKGLLIAVLFTCIAYLIPLFAITAAVDVPQSQWGSGFHAEAAEMIAGKWLKIWIEIGAALSAAGIFEAQLSSNAYQILGMAELGMIPSFFGSRAKWFHTPWVGILLSTVVCLPMAYLNFGDVVGSANLLYSLGMLLEFVCFVWLRWKKPDIHRPYKVPLGIPGLVAMCSIPSLFLVLIMVFATKIVFMIAGLMTAGGIGFYFLMNFCRSREIFKFSKGVEEDRNGSIEDE